MRVFGCDFSGAKLADKKICICEGQLDNGKLTLLSVHALEDRLDLVREIWTKVGVWGIDMPFSLPRSWLTAFGDWRSMVSSAAQLKREEYKRWFPPMHSRVSQPEMFRRTDLAVAAKSPVSSTPLDMVGMCYGAFKVLDTLLLNESVCVYPFSEKPSPERSQLYEVYPRHLLNLLRMKHDDRNLENVGQAFRDRIDPSFEFTWHEEVTNNINSEHSFDAVLACLTIAYCADKFDLVADWQKQPPCLSKDEWDVCLEEGAVVRISVS